MTQNFLLISAFVAGVCATGCSTTRPSKNLDATRHITVKKADAPDRCVEIGPIEGIHGSGCGGFGTLGVYEEAHAELRNVAASRGADYVRMDSQIQPHFEPACFDNRFIIRGVAYACPSAVPEEHKGTCKATAAYRQQIDELDRMKSAGKITADLHASMSADVESKLCGEQSTEAMPVEDPSGKKMPADTPSVAAPAQENQTESAEKRLLELKSLLDKDLITKEEYEKKRLQIIEDL